MASHMLDKRKSLRFLKLNSMLAHRHNLSTRELGSPEDGLEFKAMFILHTEFKAILGDTVIAPPQTPKRQNETIKATEMLFSVFLTKVELNSNL